MSSLINLYDLFVKSVTKLRMKKLINNHEEKKISKMISNYVYFSFILMTGEKYGHLSIFFLLSVAVIAIATLANLRRSNILCIRASTNKTTPLIENRIIGFKLLL